VGVCGVFPLWVEEKTDPVATGRKNRLPRRGYPGTTGQGEGGSQNKNNFLFRKNQIPDSGI